jgi:predicted nucleic acid-binding protein
MATRRPSRYWDAGVFLAWLKNEQWRLDEVKAVLKAAEAGQILLVTSSVSFVEVVKFDRKQAVVELPDTDCKKIEDFFRRSYIDVRLFDPLTAELARRYIWDYGLATRDAMHLATASRWHLTQLDTFDDHLLDLNGKFPDINISHPNLPVQLEMTDFIDATSPDQPEDEEGQDSIDLDEV